MKSVLQCIEARLKAYGSVCHIRREDCTYIRQFGVFGHVPAGCAAARNGEDKDACAGSTPAGRVRDLLPLQEDTLYYIEEEQLLTLPEDALPCNMICSGAPGCICPEGHNLIRLTQPASPEDLSGVIGLTLEQVRQYEFMMQELLQLMDKADCAQEMVDCCSRRMRLSIAVRDTGLKNISITSETVSGITFGEPFDRIIHEDALSEKSMALIEEYNRFKNVSAEVPYSIFDYRNFPDKLPAPEGGIGGIDFIVRSGDDVIAFLTAMSFERALDETDADIMQDFVRLLSLILVRDGLVHRQPYGAFGSLLHDVITGSITDEELIRGRLNALKWPAAEDLYVAVLAGSQPGKEPDPSHLMELRSDLGNILTGSITDVYQGRVYLLIGRAAGKPALPANHRRLDFFLKTHRTVLGISTVFHEVSALNIHFLQAVSAATIGRRFAPDRQEHFYTDYSVELSVAALMRSPQTELQAFCHPVVLTLHESRHPGDRDLLNTLEWYLFSLRDVNKTCDALHIHRSTLYYRLNKLKELLGEDALEDGRCVQRLMYSFTVLWFLDASHGHT